MFSAVTSQCCWLWLLLSSLLLVVIVKGSTDSKEHYHLCWKALLIMFVHRSWYLMLSIGWMWCSSVMPLCHTTLIISFICTPFFSLYDHKTWFVLFLQVELNSVSHFFFKNETFLICLLCRPSYSKNSL